MKKTKALVAGLSFLMFGSPAFAAKTVTVKLYAEDIKDKDIQEVYREARARAGAGNRMVLKFCVKKKGKDPCKTQKTAKGTTWGLWGKSEAKQTQIIHEEMEYSKKFLEGVMNQPFVEATEQKSKEMNAAEAAFDDYHDKSKAAEKVQGEVEQDLEVVSSELAAKQAELTALNQEMEDISQQIRENLIGQSGVMTSADLAKAQKIIRPLEGRLKSLTSKRESLEADVSQQEEKLRVAQQKYQSSLQDLEQSGQKFIDAIDAHDEAAQKQADEEKKNAELAAIERAIQEKAFDEADAKRKFEEYIKTGDKIDLLLMKAGVMKQELGLNKLQTQVMQKYVGDQLSGSSLGLYVNSQIAKLGDALCKKKIKCDAVDVEVFKDIQKILGAPIQQCNQ